MALTDPFLMLLFPLGIQMQFVCHECHRALWTCVEDFECGSLGMNSDSHARLLSKGQ